MILINPFTKQCLLVNSSYFSECPRDDEGHCLPKSGFVTPEGEFLETYRGAHSEILSRDPRRFGLPEGKSIDYYRKEGIDDLLKKGYVRTRDDAIELDLDRYRPSKILSLIGAYISA